MNEMYAYLVLVDVIDVRLVFKKYLHDNSMTVSRRQHQTRSMLVVPSNNNNNHNNTCTSCFSTFDLTSC